MGKSLIKIARDITGSLVFFFLGIAFLIVLSNDFMRLERPLAIWNGFICGMAFGAFLSWLVIMILQTRLDDKQSN